MYYHFSRYPLARLATFALLCLGAFLAVPAAQATPITVIASFSVTNGRQPEGGVTFDAAGNMYGTTYGGTSSVGDPNYGGVVWEIAHGTTTITDLAMFGGYGSEPGAPYGNVAVDANGNVYGTVSTGNANNTNVYGGVFEIVAGSNALTDLGDFGVGAIPGTNPMAGVTRDAAGNLFGTTEFGSTNNAGTIWEIPAGGTLTTLASFLGSGNGDKPLSGVTLDAQGNLYGTTYYGGPDFIGNVWELPHGSNTVLTLANFSNPVGFSPNGDVAVDAQGNVYGTAGGPNADKTGCVWEVVAGTNTITDLGVFTGPYSGPSPTGLGVVSWATWSLTVRATCLGRPAPEDREASARSGKSPKAGR